MYKVIQNNEVRQKKPVYVHLILFGLFIVLFPIALIIEFLSSFFLNGSILNVIAKKK